MTRGSKYVHPSRFKLQHLDIMESLLDEDLAMAVVVRQGRTLSLLFGVGQSDKYADIKD
jgi:hypothetical protein